MKWTEVIGQSAICDRLRAAVDQGKVPHAQLFCGPSGCGKMATALALASYLLGEGRDDVPQRHNAEAMLRKWEHPDLHFTYPTIKTLKMGGDHQPISLDFAAEWRKMLSDGPYFTMERWMEMMGAANQQAVITAAESDQLAKDLSLKSSQDGYKVSVIWLPERMNQTSANKLLKLLEEPPRQTVFIMVSEEPELLLDTIKSRTQRVDFKRIPQEAMQEALMTKRMLDEATARGVARIANGDWNRAIRELEASNENTAFLEDFKSLMRLAYMRNVKELKKWSEKVSAYGREKQRRLLSYFMRMVRENFVYNFHRAELVYMTPAEESFSRNFARYVNEANVVEMNLLMEKASRDIGQNANGKIVFFDLALKMIMLLIRK